MFCSLHIQRKLTTCLEKKERKGRRDAKYKKPLLAVLPAHKTSVYRKDFVGSYRKVQMKTSE